MDLFDQCDWHNEHGARCQKEADHGGGDHAFLAEETAQRGGPQLRAYAAAMAHQLDMNGAKGGWEDRPVNDCLWQLVYHLAKLLIAAKADELDPIRIQEFAADVGNEAMILADCTGTLERVFESDAPSIMTGDEEPLEITRQLVEILSNHGILPPGFEAAIDGS